MFHQRRVDGSPALAGRSPVAVVATSLPSFSMCTRLPRRGLCLEGDSKASSLAKGLLSVRGGSRPVAAEVHKASHDRGFLLRRRRGVSDEQRYCRDPPRHPSCLQGSV